jgi:hypothetical protein
MKPDVPPAVPSMPPVPSETTSPGMRISGQVETYAEDLHVRKWLGYGIGTVGILVVGLTAFWAFWEIAKLREPLTELALRAAYAKLAAHAVVSVAVVFFGYQLVRAAERMILPHWWIQPHHCELLQLLLGVDTPVRASTKTVEKLTDLVKASRDH